MGAIVGGVVVEKNQVGKQRRLLYSSVEASASAGSGGGGALSFSGSLGGVRRKMTKPDSSAQFADPPRTPGGPRVDRPWQNTKLVCCRYTYI